MKTVFIGIDGNEANVENRVGVSWYTYELLTEFKKRADKETRFRIFLRSAPRPDLPEENEYFQYVVVKGSFLWSQIFLPLALYISHRDLHVFFSPAHYAPRMCPCPSVVTLHDLSYFYFPSDFLPKDVYQLKNWTAYSVQNAAHIISVSQKTKQDAVLCYGVKNEKISVVYNGFSPKEHVAGIADLEVKIPYFLYIGTLQPRKNIGTLLKGFAQFVKKNPNHRLYIAGRKGWLFETIFDEVKRLKVEDKVVFTGYVSEGQKQYLLQNATALVVPGFYEGFGLPVLEGFASRIPVIAALSGALPEVCGEACEYINPHETMTITHALEVLTNDKTHAKKLIEKGAQQLKRFSWGVAAAETLKILLSAARI